MANKKQIYDSIKKFNSQEIDVNFKKFYEKMEIISFDCFEDYLEKKQEIVIVKGEKFYTFKGNSYIYNGEVLNGVPHGKGEQISDFSEFRDIYVGNFTNGLRNGKGTYFFKGGPSNEDKYVGEYRNDLPNGKGTYFYNNGDKYEGEFTNDLFHGKGTFFYNNGNKYEGEYSNELRNGFGIEYDKNGKILSKGMWQNNEFIE